MYTLPINAKQEIDSFSKLINDFKNGTIEAVKFKAIRVPNFVPYGTKLDLKYLCSLTYCSIMYILVISRRRCLEGGRSPTGKHLLREPP